MYIHFPLFIMPMPINEKGQGPEMNPDLVYITNYEIWDSAFQVIAIENTEEKAKERIEKLNKEKKE